jgi:adenosylcobinamide-phosphate synthase
LSAWTAEVLISGSGFFIVIAALALDALIGDPDWLWRRPGHPVAWIGALIGVLDRRFNREDRSQQQRKTAGIACTAALVALSAVVGILVQTTVQQLPIGDILLALIASIFIAQRSLYQHVARVRSAFAEGGLAGARKAVSMIVGRDPEQLDEAGICRAAIESCAENFSDGVVAPVFWLALLGLPGLIAYKTINTADSMIGHRSERYQSFGWAAARLDDLVNLIPARLSAALLALAAPVAGGSIGRSFDVVRRDASKHRSPNAGWPESAMAGALGVALAGPRRYATHAVDDPFINAEATSRATPDDIGRALDLYAAACVIETAGYAALALVV